MGVASRRLGFTVAQNLADDMERLIERHARRGMRMPQVVKADATQIGLGAKTPPHLRKANVEAFPALSGKDDRSPPR